MTTPSDIFNGFCTAIVIYFLLKIVFRFMFPKNGGGWHPDK